MKYKNLHSNTKVRIARKKYKCEKCKKDISIGEKYFRTNTKFIKVFHRCMNCKPTRDEVNELIQEEMDVFHNEIEIGEE